MDINAKIIEPPGCTKCNERCNPIMKTVQSESQAPLAEGEWYKKYFEYASDFDLEFVNCKNIPALLAEHKKRIREEIQRTIDIVDPDVQIVRLTLEAVLNFEGLKE